MRVEFTLPDQLAEQAAQAGLLSSERYEEWLRSELRKQAFDRFFAMSKQLQAAAAELGIEPMSPEEIADEIHATRAEQRKQIAP